MYGAAPLLGSRIAVMAARTLISCLINDLLILGMGVSGASFAQTGKERTKFVHKVSTKMGRSHPRTEVPAEMSLTSRLERSSFGTLACALFLTMYASGVSTMGCDCSSPQAERQEKT